jgi:hypothetical protein
MVNSQNTHNRNPSLSPKNVSQGAPIKKKKGIQERKITVFGSMEMHIKLLHAIIIHVHLEVIHHPIKNKKTQNQKKNPVSN